MLVISNLAINHRLNFLTHIEVLTLEKEMGKKVINNGCGLLVIVLTK
jgi:hypothetical protein